MGTVVLADYPELEDFKFYIVTADSFDDDDAPILCDEAFIGQAICCKRGIDIQNWYDTGYECSTQIGGYFEICPKTIQSAQRIVDIFGPYDVLGDCQADI